MKIAANRPAGRISHGWTSRTLRGRNPSSRHMARIWPAKQLRPRLYRCRPSLDGNNVTVTDSSGAARQAPLFYISPSQINFEIPAGTATGTADGKVPESERDQPVRDDPNRQRFAGNLRVERRGTGGGLGLAGNLWHAATAAAGVPDRGRKRGSSAARSRALHRTGLSGDVRHGDSQRQKRHRDSGRH